MAYPLTNPFYSQMYRDYSEAGQDGPVVALPPCKGAYAIGPAADQNTIAVRWISYGFNYSTSQNLSKSTMIKDENDIFYVVSAYCPSSTLSVRANVYDAENDISEVYSITPPAELVALKNDGGGGSAVRSWTWMLRKRSSTALDFVVRAVNGATGFLTYQQYTWTIGADTMTFVGSYAYDATTYGESQAYVLVGSRIIDVSYHQPTQLTYHTIFDLASGTGSTTTLWDPFTMVENRTSSCSGFYYAGDTAYHVAFYGKIEGWGECPQVPGAAGPRTVSEMAQVYVRVHYFSESGDGVFTKSLGQAEGHDCTYGGFGISAGDWSCMEPDSSTVYFIVHYTKGYSNRFCPIDPYVFPIGGTPEFTERIGGSFRIGPSALLCGFAGGTDPLVDFGGPTYPVGPGQFSFPHRTNPVSLVPDPSVADTWSIVSWPNLAFSAQGVFTASGADPGIVTAGSGQRNDNAPTILTSYQLVGSYCHNRCYDPGGNLWVDQASTLGSSSSYFFPVTGYMGKWPVRHRSGRWAIFGPNTIVETARPPRWQVV
jgi:hypothetical protein